MQLKIQYARCIHQAGHDILTVLFQQCMNQPENAMQDVDVGKQIVEALSVPVIINGGIQSVNDITSRILQ